MSKQDSLITEIQEQLKQVLEFFGHLNLKFGRQLTLGEQKEVESLLFKACEDPDRFELELIWIGGISCGFQRR